MATTMLGDPSSRPLIAETPVAEVRDIPLSNLYLVKSKVFGDGKTWHEVRAYTSALNVEMANGHIRMAVTSKRAPVTVIQYPYHAIMSNGILCAMKRFKHQVSNSFALGHELFSLQWEMAAICHFIDGRGYVFLVPRNEWLERGVCGAQNRELQVFLEMSNSRRHDAGWVGDCFPFLNDWLNSCNVENSRKGPA